MVTTAVPSAPETRAEFRESTENLSPKTLKVNFRDAGELRAEFDIIHKQLETKGLSLKKMIEEELDPLLARMWALLSQRGTGRLRREAKLPTWTAYYRDMEERFNLKSLRTFQSKLKAESTQGGGGDDDDKREKPAPKRRRSFKTGPSEEDIAFSLLLTSLLGTIERAVNLQVVKNVAAECRQDLKGFPATCPEIIQRFAAKYLPVASAQKPSPKPRATSAEQIRKGAEKVVAHRVKHRTGTLIKIS